jgi:hypothetical protein
MAEFRYKIHVYHRILPNRVIIAANADTIWSRKYSNDQPLARSDGWWGPHEYSILPHALDRSSPYLAWIPSLNAYSNSSFREWTSLDPTLVNLSFEDYPLNPVTDTMPPPPSLPQSTPPSIPGLPPKPVAIERTRSTLHNLYCVPDSMRDILKKHVYELISRVRPVMDSVVADSHCVFIRLPTQAVFRLEQAYFWLRFQNSEAGHQLALCGLKRAVLELHAFLLWRTDEPTSPAQQRNWDLFKKPYRTRGTYVDCPMDYNLIGRFGVAVYYEVDLMEVTLPERAKEVDLTPIPIERHPLFPPGYKGGNHTYLYFYPPVVKDSHQLELASRGYSSRTDSYSPNRDIEKIFASIRKEQGISPRFKSSSISYMYSLEIAKGIHFPFVSGVPHPLAQRARAESEAIHISGPDAPLSEWWWAQSQINYPPLDRTQSRPPKVRTPIPPPTFFFNAATPQKQMSYFYIWFCIRESVITLWKYRPEKRESMLRTHDDWRSILSGEQFKNVAKSNHVKFVLAEFMKWDNGAVYGCPKPPPPPWLVDGTVLSPEHFLDSNPRSFELRRMACYDIALTHMKFQFERTDDYFMEKMALTLEEKEKRLETRGDLFRSSIRILTEEPDWESDDHFIKATWYERLRYFVKDWQVYDNLKPHGDRDLSQDLTKVYKWIFPRVLNALLVRYLSGVAKVLNVVPTILWLHPGMHGLKEYRTI